ncbi:MAG TPA: cysteine desulfurase-like protein [Steroidobacteraceae bacterium]|nr:cysteine desulfurase-like protein [Steroidobacteraceae bacterium]
MSRAQFPIAEVRQQFPALERAGSFAFMDNAAGAQVPRQVIDAIERHLIEHNVQRGGRYPQSVAVDAAIERARATLAAFLNARDPNEVAFGMNATSFIRLVSLAVGQSLGERNEIVVTDLDHEANIATWMALERQGARILWWKVRDDGALHAEDLRPLLSPRTRLVACTLASNALGTIVDVRAAADLAHAAGAEIFLDSVHYGPHAELDVQAFDCDYLVCSGYKIFGPHMGFLWGKYEVLKRLPTFREEFIPDEPPGKIEAGTFIFENVSGMEAAVGYLAQLGRTVTGRAGPPDAGSIRADVKAGLGAIRTYEQSLSLEMLSVLRDCEARVFGITDASAIAGRVPTFSFLLPGVPPRAVTDAAVRAGIGIRDGHLYAPRLMRRLNVPVESGVVRVSLVHYNTKAEIHRLAQVLRDLRRR